MHVCSRSLWISALSSTLTCIGGHRVKATPPHRIASLAMICPTIVNLHKECTLFIGRSNPGSGGLICYYNCPSYPGFRCTFEEGATTCRYDVEEWETAECP